MKPLGHNHDGYHGETIDIRAVLREIETAAQTLGWNLETFYETDEFKLLALHRQPPSLRTPHPAFTSAPASTATNPPARSPRCA